MSVELETQNVFSESFSKSLLDGSDERNWCTLTEEGIRGPFSVTEIRQKFNQQKLQGHHRIWHKKNAGWMHVSAIRSLLQESQKRASPLPRPLLPPLSQKIELSSVAAEVQNLDWLQKVSFVPRADQIAKALPSGRRSRLAFAAGLMVSVGLTMTTMNKRFNLPPTELKRLSSVDQVRAEEILAASGWLADFRAQVFLVSESYSNQFLVVTNQPRNQRMILRVIGKPETLIETFMAQFETAFNVSDEATVVALQPEKRVMMVPKGQYTVSLICTNCGQKTEKELFRTEMFLGGAPDDYYASSLKKYHVQLRSQATEELNYLKQLAVAILKLGQMKASKNFQEEKQVIATEIESLEADVQARKYFYTEYVSELRNLLNESLESQLSPEAKSNFVRKIDDLLGRIDYLLKVSFDHQGFPKKI